MSNTAATMVNGVAAHSAPASGPPLVSGKPPGGTGKPSSFARALSGASQSGADPARPGERSARSVRSEKKLPAGSHSPAAYLSTSALGALAGAVATPSPVRPTAQPLAGPAKPSGGKPGGSLPNLAGGEVGPVSSADHPATVRATTSPLSWNDSGPVPLSSQKAQVTVTARQAASAMAKPARVVLPVKAALEKATKAAPLPPVKSPRVAQGAPRDAVGMSAVSPPPGAVRVSGTSGSRTEASGLPSTVSVAAHEPQGWKVSGIRIGGRALAFNIKPPATPPIRVVLTRRASQRLEALSLQVRGGALQHALTPDRQLLASRLESLGMGRPDVTVQTDGGGQTSYSHGERTRAAPPGGGTAAATDGAERMLSSVGVLDFRA